MTGMASMSHPPFHQTVDSATLDVGRVCQEAGGRVNSAWTLASVELAGEGAGRGRLAGAALDVHVHEGNGQISPLAALPNVVLTPHIGAGTFDSQREIGEIVMNEVEAYVNKQLIATADNGG